ncbi:unnamed protein product [Protopolystoma xenopodis]|uniref:Uncharacterized protein n=1 Tax=Protopolystoma xenopodis TaxID=117903 RepID=A0A448WP60_9PLAT|nr:unnamed protein product [Protopolystoma xenopodis]
MQEGWNEDLSLRVLTTVCYRSSRPPLNNEWPQPTPRSSAPRIWDFDETRLLFFPSLVICLNRPADVSCRVVSIIPEPRVPQCHPRVWLCRGTWGYWSQMGQSMFSFNFSLKWSGITDFALVARFKAVPWLDSDLSHRTSTFTRHINTPK